MVGEYGFHIRQLSNYIYTIMGDEMFQVYIEGKSSLFPFLKMAKEFAKASGLWYYIADGFEIIWTQDDDVMELLNEKS